MPRSPAVPSYRLHRPSGQAVVTIRTAAGERRDVYLGEYDSPESRAEYGRVIAELATGAPVAVPAATAHITVDQLLVAFHKHAEQHYKRSDGKPSAVVAEYTAAGRPLHQLYGHVPAANVGPLALKAVRQKFVEEGTCCRKTINARIGKLKRIFKWGVENELIPVTVYTALSTVAGLQAGRTTACDHEPVAPVDDDLVEAALPFLSRHIAGLVQFQRLTGARPGEAMAIRGCDIDMTGAVWLYRPAAHKSKHRGKTRTIAIGARGQELLRQFFTTDIDDYLFSPRRGRGAQHQASRGSKNTDDSFAREPPPEEEPEAPARGALQAAVILDRDRASLRPGVPPAGGTRPAEEGRGDGEAEGVVEAVEC
jgi:integrase